MEHIQQAMELKAELESLRPIKPDDETRIMQKFRLDWDYHSNHLEGNSLSYGETKALIMFGITAQGKPLKDHFEITGHDEAIKWVIEVVKGDYPLTETFIRELHVLLLKEPYERPAITPDSKETTKRIEVGRYKTQPNHVLTKTGEIFRFATPEETPALMHDLINWYREKKNNPETNSILLAAEFHYKFIRIHPFDDGNGRMARILMNFILMQFGYPPVIIKTDDKGNYFSALQQADSGIIEPFIEYVAQNLVRSLEIMITGAKGENIEEPDDIDKEIALLEQKLQSVGTKIEIQRSRESIRTIFNISIIPLTQKFIDSCKKFNKFYYRSNVLIADTHKYWNKNEYDLFFLGSKYITEDTDHIFITYNFEKFNQAGFGEFNFINEVAINFGLFSYSVSVRHNDRYTPVEKKYNEQLTEQEINQFVRMETEAHKIYIEKKLQEVQNQKK